MAAGRVGVVRVKEGVSFARIAAAGFRLLAAIEGTARALGVDLTITSACDGRHTGPTDPHHLGAAYDVRAHGFSDVQQDAIVFAVMGRCSDRGEPFPRRVDGIPRSYATDRFFGHVEAAGTPNEHLHFQLRRGTDYP